jgi:hypothetical protein
MKQYCSRCNKLIVGMVEYKKDAQHSDINVCISNLQITQRHLLDMLFLLLGDATDDTPENIVEAKNKIQYMKNKIYELTPTRTYPDGQEC